MVISLNRQSFETMDIYIFIRKRNERVYKFAVYAKNKENAVFHMQQMHRLFVEQYSKLEQAKLDASFNESSENQASWQTVVEEAETLSDYIFDFGSEELKCLENQFNDYLGRRLGEPWCMFTVFDAEMKQELCHFQLPSTEFNTYPEQVKKDIKHYEETNSIAIPAIEHFVTDFFKLNPRNKELHDIMKLVRDRKHLNEVYQLDKIDRYLLSEESKILLELPQQFIDECVRKYADAIAADPLFDQFILNLRQKPTYVAVEQAAKHQLDRKTRLTPLMYAVDRRTVWGKSTEEAKMYALKSSRLLLEAGADVGARDCWGRTPLMYVVLGKYSLDRCQQTMPGREQVARLLLEYGADPGVRDKLGSSVIDHYIAECGEHHPVVSLLRRAIELRDLAIVFDNSSSEEPNSHLADHLDKAELMQFIFFVAHEFKSHPEKLQQFPYESMMYLHRKIDEIKKSEYFAGLENETQQHFLSLFVRSPYPHFLKDIPIKVIKVNDLSEGNGANAARLSISDKAELNLRNHLFLLGASQRDCKVTEKDLDEHLSRYKI
jgi:hypothetical protein